MLKVRKGLRWQIASFVIMLLILILLGYFSVRKEKKRNKLLRLRINMMECDYKEVLHACEEKEILLHDIKNHIRAIRRMAETGQSQKIIIYLDEINEVIQKGRNRNLVNHDLLNLILNQKFQEAEEAHISVEYEMEDMCGLQLKPTEICALFSNILDNAIEANKKGIEDKERWIKMTCIRREQGLIIYVSNPMTEKKVKFAAGILETTKQERGKHGFGMRSIRKIVNAHDGHMLIETEGGIFRFTVYLKGFCS